MKAGLFFLFVIVSCRLCYAQQLKTATAFGVGISSYSSSSKEVKNTVLNSFCFQLKEEYVFSAPITIGLAVDCRLTKGAFQNREYKISIPEVHHYFQHQVSSYSLDLPVFIKVRTSRDVSKGVYFYIGGGPSYIFCANRKVERLITYDGSSKKDVYELDKGNFTLKSSKGTSLGFIGLIGIGKTFNIKNKTLFYELKYTFDMNDWVYPTVYDAVNNQFLLKRNALHVNLGMCL